MISSLFRLASDKEPVTVNNKNDTQKALNPQMQTEALVQAKNVEAHATERAFRAPDNLDQLSKAAHTLLMDKNLEVGKVRPFFWSMVETYVDRFQIYPFDVVKALFSYLESRDYPPEQMLELVKKLEQSYLQQHGKPMRKTAVKVNEDEERVDEVRELRESLKYAALVGELEEEC